MADKLDDLASHVDDALVSAEELQNDTDPANSATVDQVKKALQHAKDRIEELEDAKD